MSKQALRLFFFSGFYESIHNSAFESEEESVLQDYEGKKWDDFRWTYDYKQYCKNYVSAISREIGIDLEFKSMWSPREYNFATDEIEVYIKSEDVDKLATVKNSDTLRNIIKRRFTSRDGFCSFYSNDIDEWNEKEISEWDEIELGTLLDAWIVENDLDLENLDYAGYDYCSGNGQYVDYEETEASKERTKEAEKLAEKNAELAELHEQELAKWAQWKKSVSSWIE